MANVNFFMNVPVRQDGAMAIEAGLSKAGDFVELVAEVPVIAVLSNCPQRNNPAAGFGPTPIEVIFVALDVTSDRESGTPAATALIIRGGLVLDATGFLGARRHPGAGRHHRLGRRAGHAGAGRCGKSWMRRAACCIRDW